MDRSHNPEFTMLEFYWAYSDFIDIMQMVEKMIKRIAEKVNSSIIVHGDSKIDLTKPFAKRSFFDLLEESVGHDLSKTNKADLAKICKDNGIDNNPNFNIGKMLDELMSKK